MTKDRDVAQEYELYQEHSYESRRLAELPDFGVGLITLKAAGELIACDLWVGGNLEVPSLEDFEGSYLDPAVMTAVQPQAAEFEEKLINAVEAGRLPVAHIRRDLDERIIPEETLVVFQELDNWLLERSYESGEAFDAWIDREAEISNSLVDELIWLRSISADRKHSGQYVHSIKRHPDLGTAPSDEVLAAYKAQTIENDRLRARLAQATKPTPLEKVASPRHRRTLLTIIAALAGESGIDITRRGAAQRIALLTEQIGTPIDDETIRKILSDVPDALESRSKL